MGLAIAGVSEPIIWAIHRNDPLQVALDNPAGWSALNPTSDVPNLFKSPYDTRYYFRLDEEILYLATFQLAFLTANGVSGDEISEVAESLLRRLRFVTKQVKQPVEVNLVQQLDIETSPPSAFPEGALWDAVTRMASIRDWIYDTPITMEAVRQAGMLPSDFASPIYDSLLMDAMRALVGFDYRTAILYSAIAVEALSGILCEEEHQRLFNATPRSDTVRSITTVQAGGVASEIDPIYRQLSNSNSFSTLLSELPLYVFRRSMLHENQTLYQRALCLYRTRNNLAHRGQITTAADVFPVNRAGAIAARECAIEVFGWFGAPATYFIPRGAMRKM